MTKILVVDDHQLFADGIRMLLTDNSEPTEVSYACNSDEALQRCAIPPGFDLILLDLNLPGTSGLSLLYELHERKIWNPVLMISASESVLNARCAMEQGASGYICKSADAAELLQAIDAVLAGNIYLPKGWQELIENVEPVSVKPHEEAGRITPRKLEILHLVAHGHPNKVIATKLSLSENTVKVHLRELFRALNVTNRTACVREAERLGLVQSS